MIGRAALFVTCLADTLYPSVGIATVTVLERLGVSVSFPREQTCCGQMHLNSGYVDEAQRLARRFVDVFASEPVVVTPSASCAAHVRDHFGELLGDDTRGVPEAVVELSQLLVGELGLTDLGARFDATATYHPTCHSLRVLRVGDSPLQLLREVDGLELVELPEADECCGFGGTFAVKNAAVSSAMLADKMVAPDLPVSLRPTGVEIVEDDGLTAAELDVLDAALTICAVACAETGSIALDGGPGQGRRAITLVPDLHVCIVGVADIVETVPEFIARLAESALEGRPIVIVSGPSATSDIELDRVEGVHGPRRLVVVQHDPPAPSAPRLGPIGA